MVTSEVMGSGSLGIYDTKRAAHDAGMQLDRAFQGRKTQRDTPTMSILLQASARRGPCCIAVCSAVGAQRFGNHWTELNRGVLCMDVMDYPRCRWSG